MTIARHGAEDAAAIFPGDPKIDLTSIAINRAKG
jgi:hypothetical protein